MKFSGHNLLIDENRCGKDGNFILKACLAVRPDLAGDIYIASRNKKHGQSAMNFPVDADSEYTIYSLGERRCLLSRFANFWAK